ncbi:TetR family transcriptional regulator [Streptomyces sp. WAC 01529]|uniref:TetR/AcrR family transcriptional regulator n=1 Tax=Streptomyces sp. WAC 01529 TaxID=2203205 RepID=UPI0013DFD61F|nr:TetR family transcriptional regulator [Streptomyces sp. WAC 01529]
MTQPTSADDQPGFRRARSPEHKAQRRQAILDAARGLATERGVRAVTLGDIAREVGLTKSNVLRYFETREAIYLHLSAAGYRDWAARVQQAVRAGQPEPLAPARLAGLLADSLDADPLFCDLLSDTAATLEHNVSLDAVRTYKEASTSAVHTLTAALTGPHTGLGAEAAQDLILATALLTASTWTATHPSATLIELYRASPELGALAADFAPELARLLTLVVRGLRAPA